MNKLITTSALVAVASAQDAEAHSEVKLCLMDIKALFRNMEAVMVAAKHGNYAQAMLEFPYNIGEQALVNCKAAAKVSFGKGFATLVDIMEKKHNSLAAENDDFLNM